MPSIRIDAHVQNIGWLPTVRNSIAGTTGNGLKLEALKISLENIENVKLSFDVHVQNIGWIHNVSEEDIIGTTGIAKGVEALIIRADGLEEQGYRLEYRAHVQNIGWMDWMTSGEMVGTEGLGKSMEALEARIVKTGNEKPPVSDLKAAKEEAIQKLDVYKNSENQAIRNIAKNGIRAIHAATSKEEINEALEDAISAAKSYSELNEKLDTLMKQVNELFLKDSKERAVSKIESAKAATTNNTDEAIVAIYDKAIADIKGAISQEEIDSITAGAEKVLKNTDTALTELNNYITTTDVKRVQAVEEIVDGVINNITVNTTDKELESAISEAKDAIKEIKELAGKIDAALSELNTYISKLSGEVKGISYDETTTYAMLLQEVISSEKASIQSATSEEEINEALDQAKGNIYNATKSTVRDLYTEQYNNPDLKDGTAFITEYSYSMNMEEFDKKENDDVEKMITVFEAAMDSRVTKAKYNTSLAIKNAIDDLTNFDNTNYSDTSKATLKTIIDTALEDLEELKTKESDDTLYTDKAVETVYTKAKTGTANVLSNSSEDMKLVTEVQELLNSLDGKWQTITTTEGDTTVTKSYRLTHEQFEELNEELKTVTLKDDDSTLTDAISLKSLKSKIMTTAEAKEA